MIMSTEQKSLALEVLSRMASETPILSNLNRMQSLLNTLIDKPHDFWETFLSTMSTDSEFIAEADAFMTDRGLDSEKRAEVFAAMANINSTTEQTGTTGAIEVQ